MAKISVYDRLKKAEASPAWNRAGAYVILKDGQDVGRIKCKYPLDGMGQLDVFLWDWTAQEPRNIQHGWARGCGYDKLSAALDGLQFGEIVFKENPTDWRDQLRKAGYNLIAAL